MNLSFRLACSALILFTNGAVLAETSTQRIDARQAKQQQRINQGVATGQLTPAEAARLQHGQAHVQQIENRATADGVVTGQERARIEQAQDAQSRRIAKQKHDRQHDLNHNGRVDRPRKG